MKDIYELLRQKERELSRLETEVEALRIVAPLLSNDNEGSNDNMPSSARSTVPSPPIQVSQAVNVSPQPVHAAEWKVGTQGWP
jgi:hypothetical protein